MEEFLDHFSHEQHALRLSEVDDPKPYVCGICGLPILSNPSYTCTAEACNFSLHKACAQLPRELNHPTHDPDPSTKHTLRLVSKSPSARNFTYRCHYNCEFDLHPLVAVPVADIKIQHQSHQSHPLVAICREVSRRCDACGEEQKGIFFCCQLGCDFWIHQDCTLIPHFSHDHSLTFFKVDDHEDPKPYLCRICGLPILSSPAYTCRVDPNCNFFLHKACVDLPKEVSHPNHDPDPFRKHPLYLVPKLPDGQNFAYKCDYHCEFDLHPLAAVRVEIKSKHRSHQPHPLVAICREITSRCDACGEEHKGFFFCCQECNFWIQQDCAVLPGFVKLRSHFDHPFLLTYSLPSYILQGGCFLCDRQLHLRDTGVYFCGECDSLAHLSCAKSSMVDLKTETRLELIQLPPEGDTFPSSVIGRYLENHPFTDTSGPLVLEDGVNSSTSTGETSRNLVCDVCIQPIDISSPFYRCQLESSEACHFLAHDICTLHLRRVTLSFGFKPLLRPGPTDMVFNSIFPCFFCHRPCNGFCHYKDNISFGYFFDVECLSAPKTIRHASHRHHVLFRLGLLETTSTPLSCCSGKSLYLDIYRCTDCSFYIHVGCALLPNWTSHKFDEHPLELITDGKTHEHLRFCEVCEDVIEQRHWYYGCGECEYYFHINCIPSVGYLSRVKFGEALAGNGVHPDHPLTLTRMLTHGRHERCGYCREVIRGCVDQMAFHCSECDFWIHFSCARDTSPPAPAPDKTKSTRLRSKVYSELEDNYFRMFSRFTAASIRSLTM